MNYKGSPLPSCLQNHSTANKKVAIKPEITKKNVPPGTLVLPTLSRTSLPHDRPIMLTPGAVADTFSAATENSELNSISLSRRDC